MGCASIGRRAQTPRSTAGTLSAAAMHLPEDWSRRFQGENTPSSTHSAVVHWNQVVNPTMINDFSVSYGRLKWGIGRPTDVPDVSKEMGLVNTSNRTGGPQASVPDFTIGSSGLFVWDPTQNTYALKDDFAW